MKFGPYLLENRIAVGGTAEVYMARPADSSAEPQKLVVKRMLPDLLTDSDGRTMFAREAELHALVRHPNVVTVFATGHTDDGEPYLAMEFIDGMDARRLLRRIKQDMGRGMPTEIAVFIAHEVLRALASVHAATDTKGKPLAIVHRDVTPSNIYLSRAGEVKLGDFGIARTPERATLKSTAAGMLKGKFAYLAPEQVASEAVDSRADLFSLSTVLSEFLIGDPLFPGQGQLAVLLAIRDCRIDALTAIAPSLPRGLYEVLLKGLTRDVESRWRSAAEFADALAPFASKSGREDLAALVGSALHGRADLRDSTKRLLSAPVIESEERTTAEYTSLPSFARTRTGTQLGPWQFARVVEAVATGEIGRGDLVDYMGQGFKPLEQIEDLARFLPMLTAPTSQLAGPGLIPASGGPWSPNETHDLARTSMLDVLLSVLERADTGVLFAERVDGSAAGGTSQARRDVSSDSEGRSARKELYFVNGRLHHVASSNASELLGEYLVRRDKLKREDLDTALAVLPHNQGRMGEALISLGFVSPVDVFQAIREQGRDRVADLFAWKTGTVSFYRGQSAQHVEFPLDLDLASLILAGMEAALPGESALERYQARLHHVLGPGKRGRDGLAQVKWPPQVSAIEALARRPRRLSEILSDATAGGHATAGSVLRVVDVLLAAKLLELTPA